MKHRFSRGDLKRLILPLFFEQLLVMLVGVALITVFRQLGNHVRRKTDSQKSVDNLSAMCYISTADRLSIYFGDFINHG